jgi:hypothetical protein
MTGSAFTIRLEAQDFGMQRTGVQQSKPLRVPRRKHSSFTAHYQPRE